MILPIIAYGNLVLKKKAIEIQADYPKLDTLIENMWKTMYNASGVGLAAPQIGLSIRLFIVDTSPFGEDEELSKEEQETLLSFKKVFINPTIEKEEGEEWEFSEGCLSIPNIRENVSRKEQITIHYLNEQFEPQKEVFDGLLARVIQHEYDHIEGILFTDKLSPLKKKLLTRKLNNIAKGKITEKYKMKFPSQHKK